MNTLPSSTGAETRKPYKAPVLIVHGDIEAITGTKTFKFKKNIADGFGSLDSNPFAS
jgi:hypothetical protein